TFQFDIRFRIFQIETGMDFLQRLLDSVADFLQVNFTYDIKSVFRHLKLIFLTLRFQSQDTVRVDEFVMVRPCSVDESPSAHDAHNKLNGVELFVKRKEAIEVLCRLETHCFGGKPSQFS